MTRARRQATATGEAGFGLIEVVISAAVLLMVTMGTLALIDGAQHSTVQNRARTAAADLAEQDQEQLRATASTTLAGPAATGRQGYSNPHSATVGGVTYDVASTATWVRDSSGLEPSCTDPDGVAEYLKLTSTVSPRNSAAGIAPVTITSLLTPTTGAFGRHVGTLTVELKDRNAVGLPGVPVTVTGGQSATQSTNAAGCAIFNYFPSGGYSATWFKSGFVDPDGVTSPSATTTVTDNATTRVTKLYDQAGGLNLRILTKGGATSDANVVTVANPKMALPREFPEAGPLTTSAASIDTGLRLFPFADGYSVYTGDCSANSPSGYTGQTTATVPSLAGGITTPLNVSQPPLAVKVTNSSNAAVPNADVVAIPTAADQALGCSVTYRMKTDGAGVLSDALPYGHFTFCVDDNKSSPRRSTFAGPYNNVDLNTGINTTLKMSTTSSGSC